MANQKPGVKILMEKKVYEKNGKRWVLSKTEKELVSELHHKNATEKKTLDFFRSLGGSERNEYNYTSEGYKVVKNTSISPDGQKKIVREFNFSRR